MNEFSITPFRAAFASAFAYGNGGAAHILAAARKTGSTALPVSDRRLLAVGAHLINLLLRLTLCPEANYFFTYGAEIGVLKLFWRIIPAPLLYGLPAPLILAGYMYAVCALSRLTQRAEEVPFS